MNSRRLTKEFQRLSSGHFDHLMMHISLQKPDDIYNWIIVFKGPIGTPYEDGIFFLECKFPQEYPIIPPEITFITDILHLNCNSERKCCFELINDKWSPALTLSCIIGYLIEAMKYPQVEYCMNYEIAEIYNTNIEEYNNMVRDFTLKHCPNL